MVSVDVKHHVYLVFTVKNVEDARGSSNTLVVKSRPVSQAAKNTWVCKHTLVMVAGIRSSRLELGAGNTETFAPSSTAGITRAAGKR